MTNLLFVHVPEWEKKLEDDTSCLMLLYQALLLDLSLNFSALVERPNEVQCLLEWAEVSFDHIHDHWVVQLAKNVVFTLHVVFVARLQWYGLHRKPDLVVVLLFNQLDDAVLSRAETVSDVEHSTHFFRPEDAFHVIASLTTRCLIMGRSIVKTVIELTRRSE